MKKIIISLLILSLVLLNGCYVDCGYGYACDARCKGEEANRLCTLYIQEQEKESRLAFACTDEVNDYIIKNNLTCDMNSITANPMNHQQTIYECCRTCMKYNESGSDTTFTICKQNKP